MKAREPPSASDKAKQCQSVDSCVIHSSHSTFFNNIEIKTLKDDNLCCLSIHLSLFWKETSQIISRITAFEELLLCKILAILAKTFHSSQRQEQPLNWSCSHCNSSNTVLSFHKSPHDRSCVFLNRHKNLHNGVLPL